MDLLTVKTFFSKAIKTLDPRDLHEEFKGSCIVWESSHSDYDIFAKLSTSEKVAIILKPYFKVLGYLALIPMIVLASLHLTPFAIGAGVTVALGAILTIGATYLAEPDYFKPSYTKRITNWLKNHL